ncbi:ERF family protein [Pseudomonas luteola]|uniref:ERF family protein n=1 Tax=Pseudomonas luteola TaxID=47886 RepID=UPI003A8AA386
MKMSDQIDALAKALAAAQAEIENASKASVNPHFKNRYADLAEILNTSRPVLSKHGLSIVQMPFFSEGKVGVETVLMHESGQWIANELLGPCVKQDPQGVGSAITYYRRYSLAAFAGIAQEDDDGSAASQSPANTRSKPESVPSPKRITKDDADTLRLVIKAAGMTEAEFCEMAKLDALESMELNRFAKACEHLKQKAKANAA